MRFFHIADLHIGKQLGGIDLTEDLRHVLFGQVLGSAYEKFRPDGLIIAGDIYDRSNPSAEAVELFDEFLSKAAELSLPVYAISGNHDNPQRVSYGRKLFSSRNIFMCEPFSAEAPATIVPCGDINIVLLPYISAEMAAQCYPDEDITDITSALKTVLRHADIPRSKPCLLVAHQAVAKDGVSPIGSLEAADHHVFEDFSYTALGHFHTPRCVGTDNIRYCGSPLCYSAKEAQQPQKYIDVIDIAEDDITVIHHPIIPLRPVRTLSGSFDELISDKYASSDDLLYITVCGENAESDAARRIMAKFPNCISIKYENISASSEEDERSFSEMEFSELFSGFFRLAMGQDIDPELLKTAEELFRRSEGKE